MKVKVKHYCDMNDSERAQYIGAQVQAYPDLKVPQTAKAGNYLVPVNPNNGNPSTEGTHPGVHDWRTKKVASGIQNFSFFDVMEVRTVGYRGKLCMESERFNTTMLLSTTCDAEVLGGIYGGYVQGRWVFKKQGSSYVLVAEEVF